MSENRYTYDHRQNLSPPEVFVWIALNETRKQLGLDDLASAAAILLGQNDVPVSGKVGGAVEGTSVASLAARKLLPFRLARRLPTLTKGGALGVRIAMTRSAGAFRRPSGTGRRDCPIGSGRVFDHGAFRIHL